MILAEVYHDLGRGREAADLVRRALEVANAAELDSIQRRVSGLGRTAPGTR